MQGEVYILQCITRETYYIGSSCDPLRRLREHNGGQVTATRSKGPWQLVFRQKYETLKMARQVEYKVKRMKSRRLLERIIQDQQIIMGP